MGLDVTAYRKIERVGDWPEGAEGIDDFAEYKGLGVGYVWQGHRVVDVSPSYTTEARDFREHNAALSPGIYTYADRMGFRAGS